MIKTNFYLFLFSNFQRLQKLQNVEDVKYDHHSHLKIVSKLGRNSTRVIKINIAICPNSFNADLMRNSIKAVLLKNFNVFTKCRSKWSKDNKNKFHFEMKNRQHQSESFRDCCFHFFIQKSVRQTEFCVFFHKAGRVIAVFPFLFHRASVKNRSKKTCLCAWNCIHCVYIS